MLNWLPLETEQQLDSIVQLSSEKDVDAVAIFKHSTRCSISSMAKSRLERSWNTGQKKIPIYYLDLLAFRSISNEIARRFSIEHESPQLIFIKNGKAIQYASHTSITADLVDSF
jgi:bacillithiol system protein YtxJ